MEWNVVLHKYNGRRKKLLKEGKQFRNYEQTLEHDQQLTIPD